jgi:hypothetical protein
MLEVDRDDIFVADVGAETLGLSINWPPYRPPAKTSGDNSARAA